MSLYIDLMKSVLTGLVWDDPPCDPWTHGKYSVRARKLGRDWPSKAHTMVGLERLNNLEWCVRDAIVRGVPGDFIECGVWRGGCAIFMKAILSEWGKSCSDSSFRMPRVFACDSFEGLPEPDPKYPADDGDKHYTCKQLAVSFLEVENNFRKYDLYDDDVYLIKGWFEDTLPALVAKWNPKFAIIRLDGDMYGSTIVALENLYPCLSPGGYVIIDDYALEPCATAVADYRAKHKIAEPLIMVDYSARYWQKPLLTELVS